ncbi:MAG: UbiD family decarboxylase [Acidimicrobiia bacterium]|nr:UbiD family decarboxylase [Acidimicrobiia bacterium]
MAKKLSDFIDLAADSQSKSKDLRTFLRQLVEHDRDQLLVVDREVDPVFEATSIVDRIRSDSATYPKYPAVLFTNIKGSDIPCLINLHGEYERLALSLDTDLQGMVEEFGRREAEQLPTKEVSPSEAPVKEVVLKGSDAKLSLLPILKHNELDGGKYVTSAISITKDPSSGRVNAGIFRAQLHGEQEVNLMFGPYQTTAHIFREHADRGKKMEVAMVLGHHPGMLLAGTTNPPGVGGELEVAGSLMGDSLEVVPAETVDLMVPAGAEIVIEGVVDTDPSTFKDEGPFGEYPLYYTGTGPQPVVKVQAITMRRKPVYVGLFNASPEHLALGGLARTGFVLSRVRDVVPNVANVHLPLSGTARMHAYISMRKIADGEPHLAAFNLFAYNQATKHIWVVDEDIDVTNEAEVMWAFATRFQADKDMVVINNSIGGWLNPPTYGYQRDKKGSLETKLIFDCTRPLGMDREFPTPAGVPAEVKERMNPDDYVRSLSDAEYELFTEE